MPARPALCLLAAAAVLFAAACSKPPPAVDAVRPVRTLAVAPRAAPAVAEFAGDVRPRVETRAGFQVGGRLIGRAVEIGQAVRRGAPLATIDARDYRLAAEASAAARSSARVERDQQRADYRRFVDLQARGFISLAELDRRKAGLDAAEARYAQTVATARSTENQAEYATLRAPHDAVVTAIDAEVGQVVAAGQSVIRLARSGEKEVLIGIPEQQLAALDAASEITVQLWAGGAPLRGVLRERSPVADPATRTFPARIALKDPPSTVALGMTATVTFAIPQPRPVIAVPLQALVVDAGATHVWRYDAASGTVRRTRIGVGHVAGNEVVVTDGLATGDVIVVAGAHQLQEGQKVRPLSDGGAPQAAPGSITVDPGRAKKG